MALVEIGLPDAFASLEGWIRVCDVRVRINPASALYKVFDLRIRYFCLRKALQRLRFGGIREGDTQNALCYLKTAS